MLITNQARSEVAASSPAEQFLVNLADEPHGHRQVCEPPEPVIHRPHVVDEFVDVTRAVGGEDLGFSREQVGERTLRSLDLARQHSLLSDVHRHEEVCIRQRLDRSVEPAERAIRLGEQHLHLGGDVDGRRRRQRRRDESPISTRLEGVGAGSLSWPVGMLETIHAAPCLSYGGSDRCLIKVDFIKEGFYLQMKGRPNSGLFGRAFREKPAESDNSPVAFSSTLVVSTMRSGAPPCTCSTSRSS